MSIDELDELLIAAAEAPPESRISLRDPIAALGVAAIERLAEYVWIADATYAGFAIRTIGRAGEMGPRAEAIAALRTASPRVPTDQLRSDIEFELQKLGAPLKALNRPVPARKPSSVDAVAPEELVEGRCYRRRELHSAGLGGNQQKGISYPAVGTYCLLFSDPSKATEYGYHDAPLGADGYRYYGEWSGPGDMTLTGGNKAILDRSTELYLFTDAACGKIFRGRYECVGWRREATNRDGRRFQAIVFELRKSPRI